MHICAHARVHTDTHTHTHTPLASFKTLFCYQLPPLTEEQES